MFFTSVELNQSGTKLDTLLEYILRRKFNRTSKDSNTKL